MPPPPPLLPLRPLLPTFCPNGRYDILSSYSAQASPLAKPTSIILVEYPKRLSHEIPDTLCGLPKVKKSQQTTVWYSSGPNPKPMARRQHMPSSDAGLLLHELPL